MGPETCTAADDQASRERDKGISVRRAVETTPKEHRVAMDKEKGGRLSEEAKDQRR